MKKPSAAQLAARKKFAEMARSGALAKKRKAVAKKTTVKKNPVARKTAVKKNPVGRDAGQFTMTVNGKRVTRFFVDADDSWSISHGFNYRLLSNATKHGAPVKFTKTRAIVCVDEDEYGQPVTEKWEIRELKFYNARETNPIKKKTSAVTVKRNPVKKTLHMYTVHRCDANGNPVYHIAHFRNLKDAKEYGNAYANAHGKMIAITKKAI